jgi:hypothetical protein
MQYLIELVRSGQPFPPYARKIPIWVFYTVRLLTDKFDFSIN